MSRIAIINSNVANLRSVVNTLNHLNIEAKVAYTPHDLAGADKLLVPGVGAFGAGMESLRSCGFVEAIRERVAAGTPTLGICLGMQLIFDSSDELGDYEGIGLLPGRVVRFPTDGPKVPHIGWNSLDQDGSSPLLKGIPTGAYAYFVHSYFVQPTEPAIVIATTDHGLPFPSVVGKGHVFGAQFHPEKSQATGQRLLRNFAAL